VPVRGIKRSEGPLDGFERQAFPEMGVVDDVNAIIVIHEFGVIDGIVCVQDEDEQSDPDQARSVTLSIAERRPGFCLHAFLFHKRARRIPPASGSSNTPRSLCYGFY
jgi:hypothetical protein